MIERWRCFARTTIVAIGVALMMTASVASASLLTGILPPIAGEAMTILAWVFTVIMALLGFAAAFNRLLVLPVIERQHEANKAWLKEVIAELGKGFEGLVRTEMTRHIEADEPHPRASDRMHGPLRRADEEMLRDIRVIRRRLAHLTRAHNVAMQMERGVAVATCGGGREPRRENDPPDADFSKRPPLPSLDALIIPDDQEEPLEDEPDQP